MTPFEKICILSLITMIFGWFVISQHYPFQDSEYTLMLISGIVIFLGSGFLYSMLWDLIDSIKQKNGTLKK